ENGERPQTTANARAQLAADTPSASTSPVREHASRRASDATGQREMLATPVLPSLAAQRSVAPLRRSVTQCVFASSHALQRWQSLSPDTHQRPLSWAVPVTAASAVELPLMVPFIRYLTGIEPTGLEIETVLPATAWCSEGPVSVPGSAEA